MQLHGDSPARFEQSIGIESHPDTLVVLQSLAEAVSSIKLGVLEHTSQPSNPNKKPKILY